MVQKDLEPPFGEAAGESQQTKSRDEAEDALLHKKNTNALSVLVIGTETRLFTPGTPARLRAESYAARFREANIICFSGRSQGFAAQQFAPNAHVHPTSSRSPLLWGWDAYKIARALSRPDVITAQDPFETGLIAWLIARAKKAPLHVQVHTDFLAPGFGSIKNRMRRLIAGFVLRRAARIRVVSERIHDSLKTQNSKLKTPVTILPIYTDISAYAELPRTKHPRFKIALLFVGRLEKEKNPLKALEALKIARDAGHDAGLTIVGSGSEEKRLRAYARANNLERAVEFAGWQKDITLYLSAADLLVMPSKFEGYGNIIIEALAAGVPVLATDVGVAREAGAMIVREREFSEALLKWISSGPRAATLANYPYTDFESYVEAYCDDIAKTAVL